MQKKSTERNMYQNQKISVGQKKKHKKGDEKNTLVYTYELLYQ